MVWSSSRRRLSRADSVSHLIWTMVPPIVMQTAEHANQSVRLGDRVANQGGLSEVERKVLVNLYRRHSDGIRALVGLSFLVSRRAIRPDDCLTIETPLEDSVADRLRHDFPNIHLRHEPRPAGRALGTAPNKVRVGLKILAHWLFRALGVATRSRLAHHEGQLVRSWVEVSQSLFGKEKGQLTLVYPFPLKVRRQLRYVTALSRLGRPFSFEGYPYSLRRYLRWLLLGKDVDLARLEASAAIEHARELVARYSPRHVLTTDEFEVASVALNDRLRAHGVFVENHAHGVGIYSVYVSYDRFVVLTAAQKGFYSTFNECSEYRMERRACAERWSGGCKTLVMVDQVLQRDGSAVELHQNSIVDALIDCGARFNVEVVVRVHPNSRVKRRYREAEVSYYEGDLEALDRPAFFAMYSTAYLTFTQWGPTHLVESDTFDPAMVYGRGERIVHLSQLESLIGRLTSSSSSIA